MILTRAKRDVKSYNIFIERKDNKINLQQACKNYIEIKCLIFLILMKRGLNN